MQKVIQHIYIIPLLLSALLSLKSFRQRWPTSYRTFSILLICVLVVELVALLWKYSLAKTLGLNTSNLWLYNCFLVPQYLFYIAVYYQELQSSRVKKVIVVVSVLYTLLAVCNMLFFQSIYSVNSFTLVMASGIILFLVITWFEQLRKEEDTIPLRSNPMAWISLGAFIFHAAFLPYILGLNYLTRNNISLAIALFYVFLLLNCTMYTLYSIAFLCKPTHQKS